MKPLRDSVCRIGRRVGPWSDLVREVGASADPAVQSPSPASRPRRGFTLIEVLVSLAIFALAAVVLSVAYLNILGSYRTLGAEQQLEEHWKLLRTVVLSEAEKEKVEEGGRVGLPDGRTLTWKALIEPTDIADLFRLTIEADAPGGNGTETWQRTQTIYLLRPAWSEPGERDRLREQTRQRMAQEERL
ncbi:prepilin-type N-terminal cleavage/methylation domain-containing protein [Oleiharenicola lentus]|uniref:Prepilin-type N-terminal cleavage/methylation domain-containing protein n=1 Tax=Oleiharenicola lentus TaxID=2508720 RepID=A0A4Q1C7L6_9BACT|nr:prepilin-type N-terminal cleavage/methylation domain-containing protein [Oleiharenicola lentus]